jgi:hypothetical protein
MSASAELECRERVRVLPQGGAAADGRLSSCLRTFARRATGVRGPAAGGDMIGQAL